jgi:hypothetical protein
MESQAKNVVHPSNREFQAQVLASSHNPVVTIRNGISSKITNTSRQQGSSSQERELPHESENPKIQPYSKKSDITKKGYVCNKTDERGVYFGQ